VKPPYSSDQTRKIYQRKPVFSKPSQFRPKGWTETVEGYIREAGKLRTLILLNRKLSGEPYTWHVTINFEKPLSPSEIKTQWEKVCRNLRVSGIVALWIREPTRSDKVHYHLILRTRIDRKNLEKIIKAAMPTREPGDKRAGWHKSIKPVTDDWQLAHYVTKAKIVGFVKGRRVDDYYANKRLLFVTGLPLNKVGEIGGFWFKSKSKMWHGVKAAEQRIEEGLNEPNVKRLAHHVHELLDGYVPLRDIERSFGCFPDSPAVRQWIDQLLRDEWERS
jgi:hypothetical protein